MQALYKREGRCCAVVLNPKSGNELLCLFVRGWPMRREVEGLFVVPVYKDGADMPYDTIRVVGRRAEVVLE